MLDRRAFLTLSSASLLLPRRLGAATANDRKFLFIFADGGWDTTKVFTPMFGRDAVEMDDGATEAETNGITFTDSELRPAVRTFFETWGSRACIINGIEVRSITHERCRRIALTGGAETGRDDWGSTLGANAGTSLVAPYLVVVGTSFTDRYTSQVVRVGSDGQLPRLLDRTAFDYSDMAFTAPTTSTETLTDAWVRERASGFAASAGRGRPRSYGERYVTALDQVAALSTLSGTLDLRAVDDGCNRNAASDAAIALDCFERGIARCAMVRNDGWCEFGWDTHSDNDVQDKHYEQLFGYVNEIMADLESRTALDGSPLSEQVTIVMMSEMGRTPRKNDGAGRDHWTFTSAMLIGSGIRGGQVVGEMDDSFYGRPIDLGSGEATDTGTYLVPGHLGATLLALGDVDPGSEGITELPIEAVLA